MNNSSLAKNLGRWNPQLLREFRGRIKPRTVLVSVAFSAIGQILLVSFVMPNSPPSAAKWLELWKIITWILPYVLFTLGTYFIVSDIAEEQKRGTLNFIRLSPRPAWQILLGKLLGVPVLLYLAVGLAIPLHCFAGLRGGVSLPLILSVYLLLAAGCAVCYSAAMFLGLPGGEKQGLANRQAVTAIGFAAIVFSLVAPSYMAWNINVTWRPLLDRPEILGDKSPVVSWFFLPINTTVVVSHSFTLLTLGIAAFLLWRMLLRNFRKPRSTPIGKRQSYAILAFVEVLALGFLVPISLENAYSASFAASFMYVITAISLLVLMFGICPQRQALLDWAGYSSQSWQSLIWSDKSPALLAFVIHLIVANALLLPWLFTLGIGTKKVVETILLVIATANIILIYGTFVQQVFATKIRNPIIWAIGGLSLWSIVAPTLLGLLQLWPDRFPATAALWTLFGYAFWQFDQPETIPFVGLGIAAQWLFLAFLLWRFQKTMRKLKAGI